VPKAASTEKFLPDIATKNQRAFRLNLNS